MKQYINYTLILLITILIAVPTAANAMKKRKKNTFAGRTPWSLEVAFDVNEDNSQAERVRISVKNQINQFSAWRLSLGLVQNDFMGDFDRSFYSDGYHYEIVNPSYSRFEGAELSAQYLFYPTMGRNLRMYIGVGPKLAAYKSERSALLLYEYDPAIFEADIIDAYEFTRVEAGLETSLGLEWFLGSKFSLLGEWSFNLGQRWYTYDAEYHDTWGHHWEETEWIDDGIHAYDPQFSIGVAIHF